MAHWLQYIGRRPMEIKASGKRKFNKQLKIGDLSYENYE